MPKYRINSKNPFIIYKQPGSTPTSKDTFIGSGRSEAQIRELVRLANIGLRVEEMAKKERAKR